MSGVIGVVCHETTQKMRGLISSEVIDVTPNFLEAVEKWLDNSTQHFGRSAFGTLHKMLQDHGVNVSIEQLAKETLLM